MRRRINGLVLALVVLATGLTGCGGMDREDLEEVRSAIRRTEALSTKFVYAEETFEGQVQVEGLVEDDFRYKARLAVDGKEALDEVVSDDAIADRVLDESALRLYRRAPDEGATEAPRTSANVRQALETRRWVLDPVGAPDLLASASDERALGDDPIYDSLTVFRYLEQTLTENAVVEFDRFDFDYKPQDDPFPTPEDDSDVTRYDIRPPRLPKEADSIGGNQAVPTTAHFRKMAIYVKDGLIIRILEDIDVEGRLDEIRRNYDIEFPPGTSNEEAVQASIDAINAVRRGQGERPIRVRKMTFELRDPGDEVKVALPTEGVVQGSLAVLAFRGRLEPAAAATS